MPFAIEDVLITVFQSPHQAGEQDLAMSFVDLKVVGVQEHQSSSFSWQTDEVFD